MTQTYTLPRTGDVPVRFEGEHIGGTSTQRVNGQDRNRWFEVDLYRTNGGTYIISIVYMTLWQGETFVSRVYRCDDAAGVRDALRDFDPLQDVGGYPPGETYAAKQSRLERTLRMDWDSAIRELFKDLSPEFAEEVA